jgi:hypothetical protein
MQSTVKITDVRDVRTWVKAPVDEVALPNLSGIFGEVPHFVLRKVWASGSEVKRTYTLDVEGVSCEVTETYPDRCVFNIGEGYE